MKKYLLLLCVVLLAVFSSAFAETETAAQTDTDDPFEFVHKIFFPLMTPEEDIIDAFESYENENESLQVFLEGDSIDGSFYYLIYNRKAPVQYMIQAYYTFTPGYGLTWLSHDFYVNSLDDSVHKLIWSDVVKSKMYSKEDISKELTEYFKDNGGGKKFSGKEALTYPEDVTDTEFRNLILNQAFTKNENLSFYMDSEKLPYDQISFFSVYDGNKEVRRIWVDARLLTDSPK